MSAPQRYKGKIRWFNSASKEGMVRSECGVSLPFYGCNAIGSKSGFSHLSCIDFEEGQEVEFEYHETLGATSVSGGVFNQEDYDRLNVKDSTFQMDDDGEFISGLGWDTKDPYSSIAKDVKETSSKERVVAKSPLLGMPYGTEDK